MEVKYYIIAFEKYIERVILPKFPEINNFDVQSESDPELEKGYVYIRFYYVGDMQYGFMKKLHREIQQMQKYLSVPSSITVNYNVNKGNNLS